MVVVSAAGYWSFSTIRVVCKTVDVLASQVQSVFQYAPFDLRKIAICPKKRSEIAQLDLLLTEHSPLPQRKSTAGKTMLNAPGLVLLTVMQSFRIGRWGKPPKACQKDCRNDELFLHGSASFQMSICLLRRVGGRFGRQGGKIVGC